MARTSFLYYIDVAVRELLYTKFGSYLGIDTYASNDEENINKGVLLIPKAVAQRHVAEKRGKNFLEFINVYRHSTKFSWERNRTVVGRRGLSIIDDGGNAYNIKGVPADISYDFWVWTRDLDKLNLCEEEFIFWQHKYPKLDITLDEKFPLSFDVHFAGYTDESPLDLMYDNGKYFIKRFSFNLDGWIFDYSDASGGEISKIRMTVYNSQNLEDSEISTIVVEDSNYDSELAAATRMFRANLYGIYSLDLAENSVGLLNDFASEFVVGDSFLIENSTGNNGKYTIKSSAFDGTVTNVVLEEVLPSSVVSGNIFRSES